MSSGLALEHERIRVLRGIAEQEIRVVEACLAVILSDPEGKRRVVQERYRIFKNALDASLAAIAAETGGRVKRFNVTRELTSYAEEFARQQGYDPAVAIEIAKMIAAEGQS